MANQDACACTLLAAALRAVGRDAAKWEPMMPKGWKDGEYLSGLYPAIGADANVAFAALEEMRRLGWEYAIHGESGLDIFVKIERAQPRVFVYENGDTAPAAICAAICAALEGKK